MRILFVLFVLLLSNFSEIQANHSNVDFPNSETKTLWFIDISQSLVGVTVTVNEPISPVEIVLKNNMNKVVYRNTVTGNPVEHFINTTGFGAGVYTLTVQDTANSSEFTIQLD